ncbi:MAG: hypothetical protein IJ500_01260 [Alphaproteobacteria bacterium]|nr:hypothetical protein [Alphaproteobacteria bacterium]
MIKKLKRAIKHVRDIVINPRRYFTKIVADGNMEEAMFKAFLWGLLGGVLVFGINMLTGASFTVGALFNALIITPVMAVGILFVMGGLLMLVSEITGGERDWEIAIKALASVFFMYPVILGVNALAFNCVSLWVISMLVDAYILFLFYNISLYAMRGKRSNVILVIGIIAMFLVTVYATDYRMGWFVLKNNAAAFACL